MVLYPLRQLAVRLRRSHVRTWETRRPDGPACAKWAKSMSRRFAMRTAPCWLCFQRLEAQSKSPGSWPSLIFAQATMAWTV